MKEGFYLSPDGLYIEEVLIWDFGDFPKVISFDGISMIRLRVDQASDLFSTWEILE
jgi:hypothetical protein